MKSRRQAKIIEIIENNIIETQDELAEKLLEAGFNTTQATISRDIREMKLTKISAGEGRQRYIVLQNQDYNTTEKLKKVLVAGIVSMEAAENIIVIKTVSGLAMAVATAVDNLGFSGIIGCIAGDDTVMCVVRSSGIVNDVISNIEKVAYKESDD